MNVPFALLLLTLAASAWATSAKAAWPDQVYETPNSAYCGAAPPPGWPLGDYVAQDARLCPENSKRSGNVSRQKRSAKPKSGRAKVKLH